MKIIVLALGITLALTASATAKNNIYRYDNIDVKKILTIDVKNFRVRVDGWSKNYMELSINLKPLSPPKIHSSANYISLYIEKFKAPLWEPAIHIKVPNKQPIVIKTSSDAWIDNCTVAGLSVKKGYVRNCQITYPAHCEPMRGGLFTRQSSWQRIYGN